MADEKRQAPPRLEQALRDPPSVFDNPDAVLSSKELTQKEKIQVLRSWAYDASELDVAEEEGMLGPEGSVLHRILQLLAELTHHEAPAGSTPTKQHGPF